MMKIVAVLAALVVSTTADIFKWNVNNDFSNPTNWKGGAVPTGTADLSNGCIAEFGEAGGAMKMDLSGDVGMLVFPTDGQVVWDDDVTITLTGATENSGDWRCKEATEFSSSCSDNYVVKTLDGWVAADTAPCYQDTIQIDGAGVTSMIWGAGQYIKSVEVVDTLGNPVASYRTTTTLDDAMGGSRMFQGDAPQFECTAVGAMCQMTCKDVCPERDLALAVQDRDDFFSLPEEVRDKVIEDVRIEQDALNTLRDDAFTAFKANTNKLKQATDDFQGDYDQTMLDANYTRVVGNTQVTIAQLTLTPAQLADWMESEGVGNAHAVHYIRHSLSKDNAGAAVTFYDDVAKGEKFYAAVPPDAEIAMALDDELWGKIDEKGIVRDGGRHRRAAYNSVVDFILADANKVLATMTGGGAEIIAFTGPSAVAADATLDFNTAAGGFKVVNVVVRVSSTYLGSDGVAVSGVATEIIEVVLAATMSRMALYAKAEALRLAIHFRPTTTWSPTVSPTMSPTIAPTLSPTTSPTPGADFLAANLIPIAAGGGGGLLLIVLIIVLCVVVFAGSKKDDKEGKEERNVVAFENPMYDDPKNVDSQQVVDVSDGGLYDEPTFNASDDKENPMYTSADDVTTSADDTAGGYLDVQPDDDDDEEDSDGAEEEEMNEEDNDDEDEEEEEEVTKEEEQVQEDDDAESADDDDEDEDEDSEEDE